MRTLSVTAPASVPGSASASDSEANSATAATSAQCAEQASQQRLEQGGPVHPWKADPRLEGYKFGRDLYVAGTAQAVTLSETSAASSMTGRSVAASMNQCALASMGDSDVAVMSSAVYEGKSTLEQACSRGRGEEVPLDLTSVDHVGFDVFYKVARPVAAANCSWPTQHKPQ